MISLLFLLLFPCFTFSEVQVVVNAYVLQQFRIDILRAFHKSALSLCDYRVNRVQSDSMTEALETLDIIASQPFRILSIENRPLSHAGLNTIIGNFRGSPSCRAMIHFHGFRVPPRGMKDYNKMTK